MKQTKKQRKSERKKEKTNFFVKQVFKNWQIKSSQVVPLIGLGYGWMNICVRRRGRR